MADRPLLVAQITDCHIVEQGRLWADRLDTAATLTSVIRRLNTMSPRPDVVVATGDLVNDGRPAEYANLARVLADLELPLLALPGNHDDRDQLREWLPDAIRSGAGGRLDLVCDDFPLRIVGLDTTTPGRPGGCYSSDQMSWLDEVLSSAPDRPTLLFQHHPPFVTGIDWMDANAFDDPGLLQPVVERHPQVLGLACGHMHRPITARVGAITVTVSPSTGAQLAPTLDDAEYLYCNDPPAMTLHRWSPSTGLVSHTVNIDGTDPWLPAWADGLTG